MGYYITLRSGNFFMANDKKEEALKLFKDNMLAHVDTLGRGGQYHQGGKKESWFSWTSTDALWKAETIEDVINQFGWEPVVDDLGNITGLDFSSEKEGQEDLLFETIAPCVQEGSYLEIDGEDGELWRWYFDGQRMLEQSGKISYA